jgi:hypothetical protein
VRKLHNEELHNLYSSSIIRIIKSRRMRWAGHVARMGEKSNVYRLLEGKLEGKRPLGRPRHRWIDNIKLGLLGTGLGVVDWIDWMLVTASVVPGSPILVTLMMEALSFSGTSIFTRTTLRNIPEDAIIHSHRRENLKSYIALTGWTR